MTADLQGPGTGIPTAGAVSLWRRREGWILAALVLVVVVLACVAQPLYPLPWLDEGLNWGAVRSLAVTGRYGLDSADGFRPFATAIQTGPTVILPAVLAFWVLGPEPYAARLVTALYAVLAVVAAYRVARRVLGSPGVALIGVVLMLVGSAEPAASFLPAARQFLGEVAALAWFLVGLDVWLADPDGPAAPRLGSRSVWLAGLFFGLAGLTKSQMALVFGPSWCLLWAVSWLQDRGTRPARFLTPIVIYLAVTSAWGGVQYLALGPERFAANAALLRATALIHVITFDPDHWWAALGVLWRSGYVFWGLPTLAWLFVRARRPDAAGRRALAASALPLTSLAWFGLLSFGWGRYAFYPLSLTALYLAGPLAELWRAVPAGTSGSLWLRRGVATAVAAFLLITGFVPFVSGLMQAQDDGFQAMRRYLKGNLASDAVVATWEWPLAIDGAPRFLFPAQETLNGVTVYIQDQGVRPPAGEFEPNVASERYVLVGPFGAWTGIYDMWIAGHEPIAHFGSYALYDLTGGTP